MKTIELEKPTDPAWDERTGYVVAAPSIPYALTEAAAKRYTCPVCNAPGRCNMGSEGRILENLGWRCTVCGWNFTPGRVTDTDRAAFFHRHRSAAARDAR